MDKIRLGLFDIFAYLLPGCCMLFSIVVAASGDIQSLDHMLNPFKELSISEGILLVLASYMVGFALHVPGWWLLRYLGLNIWKEYKRRTSQEREFKERNKNTVLVREYSKVNARYIELWYALSSMARTLSLTFLFFAIVAIIKGFRVTNGESSSWFFLALGLFFFSFVLLYRAAQSYSWAVRDIRNTVKQLHLKEKARFMVFGEEDQEEEELL
ncbi:MAG: hypothetical protein AAF694_09010 [Bacteroidota bacterium]